MQNCAGDAAAVNYLVHLLLLTHKNAIENNQTAILCEYRRGVRGMPN